MQNLHYLLGFSAFEKFDAGILKRCFEKYDDIKELFYLAADGFIACGAAKRTAEEFIVYRRKINITAILENLEREGIGYITLFDENYPALLKEIFDPPPLLYCRGQLPEPRLAIAVVGARKSTAYGSRATESIISRLPPEKIMIISGLALGIDACAHKAALDLGSKTIGVIGGGIDWPSFYPGQNRNLAEKMVADGNAIISEFAPGTPPLKQNFPRRNRIIAGLSRCTLIIEAAKRSGALITAGFALEFGRDVFALPNNIFSPLSHGVNGLIKRGAYPVTCAEDILKHYGLDHKAKPRSQKPILSPDEQLIYSRLSHEPRHLNCLLRDVMLDTSKIISTLTIMEINGLVKNIGNNEYIKI